MHILVPVQNKTVRQESLTPRTKKNGLEQTQPCGCFVDWITCVCVSY